MPYSPWQQDAQAFGNIGVAMNRAILGLAQARARQNQNNQMLAIRQALAQQQAQHYDVQDQAALQKIMESRASMEAANRLAAAVKQQYMPPTVMQQFNTSPGPQAPDPLNLYSIEAPTQSQEGLDNAEVMAARALVAALAGDPRRGDPTMHNIGQNAIGINEVTGEQIPGPIVLSPGSMYDLGGEQTVNERPFFGGAGQVPFDRQGQPIGDQVPFRPPTPVTSNPSAVIGALKDVLRLNQEYPGSLGTTNMAPYEVALSNAVKNLNIPSQPVQRPSSAQTGATDRIKVKSPSGQVGTIPSSQLQQALKEGYTQLQ